MDPNELVARIRSGNGEAAAKEFLRQYPGETLESLAVASFKWGLNDVTEALLRLILKENPANIGAHKHLAAVLCADQRFVDATSHLEKATEALPDDTASHSRLCWAYFAGGRPVDLRRALRRGKDLIPKGEHMNWQPGLIVPLHMEAAAWDLMSAHRETAIETVLDSRRADVQPDTPSYNTGASAEEPPPRPVTEPFAETGAASEIGSNGATMAGRVAAPGHAADFRFEYGTTPDDLSSATPWEPLPGRLNARFVNTPTWTPRRNWRYAGEISWAADPEPHIHLEWPFGQDPNHISGIGFMELIHATWHNSCQFDGHQKANLWECSDIRDATYRLRLRTRNLDAGNALHCLGVGAVTSYWILSGQAIALADEQSDAFRDVTFRLSGAPGAWTFAGSNSVEQKNHDRYYYGPLHDCLARNTGNIVLIAPFGEPRDITTGELDIAGAELAFRDMSVLHPDAGAQLVRADNTGPVDPAALTNGIYGDPNAGWYRVAEDTPTPEIVWELAEPTGIATLVLHQDPVMPTDRCRVILKGLDGEELTVLDIDMADDDLAIRRIDAPQPVKTVTLEILSGKTEAGLGLTAIQAFAPEFAPPPSPVPVTVSADALDLPLGSEIHYRLVCRDATGTEAGEVRSIELPPTPAPVLHDVSLHARQGDKAIIRIRCNALGLETVLHWRLDEGTWREIGAGWENTPVDRYVTVRDLTEAAHTLSVRLSNPRGRSSIRSIELTP
ncbi:MAG TPA: hypothetical protein DCG48_04170 [Rhodospirillaceae bacterium]|nr:hypothetical protein [Rhodospirillaceae bacterium]|tara:strand:+ start:9169 stop:11355 length:2187 start_codon:yes stop_codon:yes gene_type:complete